MNDIYARINVPADADQKYDRLNGQVVAIPGKPYFWFHHDDDQTTIAPLGGPKDEGVFYVVPLAWLTGQEDPDVQRIGEWLNETFWERTEYTERLPG